MSKTTRPSDSSSGLESIVKATPLQDVSLVIVHVDEHYGSVECCSDNLKQLLGSRVAANVYEHSAWGESFLHNEVGIDWNPQPKERKRYTECTVDGIKYCIVDNETKPGDYHVDPLEGRRLILVGGNAYHCHQLATTAALKYLFEKVITDKVREVHLPADCIYHAGFSFIEDEGDARSYLIRSVSQMIDYRKLAGQRSHIISVNRKVVSMDASFEEPTLHLALWNSFGDMVNYLRNHERLTLKEAN